MYPQLFCPRCSRELQIGLGVNTNPPSNWDYAYCDEDRLGIVLKPIVKDISVYEWITVDPSTLTRRTDERNREAKKQEEG